MSNAGIAVWTLTAASTLGRCIFLRVGGLTGCGGPVAKTPKHFSLNKATLSPNVWDKSWHLQSKLEGSEGLLEARFPLLRSAKLCFLQLWPRFSEKRVFPQTTDFEPRIRHVRENMLECRASVLGVWMKQFADFRCYFQSTWPVFCRWQTSVTTFLGLRTPSKHLGPKATRLLTRFSEL